MQSPEAALAGLVGGPRDFDEAVVEGEAVPDGVLPALLILSVVGEQVHDELVDVAQGEHFARRVLYGHGDERYVGIGRLGVSVAPTVRLVGADALHLASADDGGRVAGMVERAEVRLAELTRHGAEVHASHEGRVDRLRWDLRSGRRKLRHVRRRHARSAAGDRDRRAHDSRRHAVAGRHHAGGDRAEAWGRVRVHGHDRPAASASSHSAGDGSAVRRWAVRGCQRRHLLHSVSARHAILVSLVL